MEFSPNINHRKWQLLLIPPIAVLVSTIISLRNTAQLRWEFPYTLCVVIAIFIFGIWQANLVVYTRLDKSMPFIEDPRRRLMYQVLGNLVATWLAFTVLFALLNLVYQTYFQWPSYLFYLLIAFGISISLNALYVIRYLQAAFFYQSRMDAAVVNRLLVQNAAPAPIAAPAPPSPKPQTLLIDAGTRQVQLLPGDIAYWFSSEGMVTLVKCDGQKLLTNYTSFAAITARLQGQAFFQLNRQYIAHLQSIRSVTDDVNRKLRVQLSAMPGARTEEVVVSRYRSAEFKQWLSGQWQTVEV
jgi:hypothetical protein